MPKLHKLLASLVAVALLGACGSGGKAEDRGQDLEVVSEEVTFKTEDDLTLTGRVFGRSRTGVVLAHMYPSDASSWYDAAKEFAAAGYMALAFNFRGYADSEGDRSPSRTPTDVKAAIAELKERGARDVALVGASMGGTAALIVGEERIPLAIVAISAPARFQSLDAVALAQQVQRPVLLMASRDDEAAFNSLQLLERALPNPDTKIYDGDAHGTALLDARPEALDEIVTFLERYAPSNGVPTTPESTEGE